MNTELLIDGHAVDLSSDESIQTVYSISDVRDITKRSSPHTRQFMLPATTANNNFFNYIFEINSDSSFNVHKKVQSALLVDSVIVMEGYVQLVQILKDNKNQAYQYVCIMYSSLINLYTAINDKYLTQLSWSGLTHSKIDKNVVQNSWTANTGYVYAFADTGLGYNNTSTLNIKIHDQTPSIFLKEFTDRIITQSGFKIKPGGFMDSDYYKSLVIKSKTDTGLEAEIEINVDTELTRIGSYGSLNYITFTFKLISFPFYGAERILYSENFNANTSFPDNYTFYHKGKYKLKEGERVMCVIESDAGNSYAYNLKLKSGNFISITYSDPEVLGSFSASLNTDWNWSQTVNTPMYRPAVFNYDTSTDPYNTWSTNWVESWHVVPPTPFKYYIPNIKCTDFISWVKNAFDLFIEADKNDPRLLTIEPRVDYYRKGSIKDWSAKLDDSRPATINILSELTSRNITLSYKEDSDVMNSQYFNEYKEVYGTKKFNTDNEFTDGEKKIELGFSTTPINKIADNSVIQPFVMPIIYNSELYSAEDDTSFNIRLMFYKYINTGWGWYLTYFDGQGYETYFNWPYQGEVDDFLNPSESLMFDTPKYVYYNLPNGYPDTNLFTKYYEKTLVEQADKNSKLVTYYVNLTPADINQLSLNDTIFIDNSYFQINKVEYDALGNNVSKVELIKVNTYTPSARSGSKPSYKRLGRVNNGIQSGKNNNLSNNSFIVGEGNTLPENSFSNLISGNNNYLYDGANSTLVNGNNNFIGYSATSVSLINSSNITASTSNFATINSSGITAFSGSNVTFIGVNNYTGETANNTTYVTYLNVLSGLSISGSSVVTDGANVGAGTGQVYSGKTGSTLNFRTLSAGTNIFVTTLTDVVRISVTPEPVFSSVTASNYYSGASDLSTVIYNALGNITAQNLGAGAGVYSGKTGNTLMFKSLSGGSNITVSSLPTVNTIALNNNIVLSSVTATYVTASTISSNNYLSGSTNLSTIIYNTVTGNTVTGSNLASPNTIYAGKTGNTFYFKNIAAGRKINVYEDTTSVFIKSNDNTVCIDKDYTVTVNDWVIVCSKMTGGLTITLPLEPYDGFEVIVKDGEGQAATWNITVDGNGKTIDGSSNYKLVMNYQATTFIFSSCLNGWIISYDYIP